MPPVYFLLHVPKTAGKSIQHHLIACCAPGVFWRPLGASDLSRALGRPYRRDDMPPPDGLGALAGHFLGRSLERYFPGRDIRRVVLLRDPVGLLVSLYNFRMVRALARGRGTYSFDLHLAALPRNFVTHYLLARWFEIPWPRLLTMPRARKYALVNEALRQFWFVGAYTECDRVMAAIAGDLGVPPVAPRVNRTAELRDKVGWRALTVDDLTAAQIRAIEAHHPIDLALWQSWRGADFAPDRVTPVPLGDAPPSFRAHEIARPAYEITRLARRRWG